MLVGNTVHATTGSVALLSIVVFDRAQGFGKDPFGLLNSIVSSSTTTANYDF